jgi:hypothetical protein
LIEEIDNVFEDHPVGWRNVFDESNPALVEEEEVGEWDGRAVGSIMSDLSQ